MSDRSVQLRAQEIIANSPDAITTIEAVERALRERFPDYDQLLKVAASTTASTLKGIRKQTYVLPDEGQGSLFEIPAYIAVTTPEGDLIVPKDHATLGQVRQWSREGQQHHSTQTLRFKRAGQDLGVLEDLDDEVSWSQARKMLAERQHEALGGDA
jgi:hypothetical protein